MPETGKQQVSVAALISKQSKLLVVRRSQKEKFLPGVFELPGGKIEFGESPADAVVREVKEETGLRVTSSQLTTARSYMSKGNMQHNVELFYLVSVDESTKVTISDAHDEYRWVMQEELAALGLPPSDPVRSIMEQYFNGLLSSG